MRAWAIIGVVLAFFFPFVAWEAFSWKSRAETAERKLAECQKAPPEAERYWQAIQELRTLPVGSCVSWHDANGRVIARAKIISTYEGQVTIVQERAVTRPAEKEIKWPNGN